jgi:hypothetical protein
MAVELSVHANEVTGDVLLVVPPGMVAADRDRALDAVLSDALSQAAAQFGAVLASPPHRFARALPGKDAEGHTRFSIRGRVEGERLSPNHGQGSSAGRKAAPERERIDKSYRSRR